jgi:hypothetical protein
LPLYSSILSQTRQFLSPKYWVKTLIIVSLVPGERANKEKGERYHIGVLKWGGEDV